MDVFDLYAKLTLDISQYTNNLESAKEKASGIGGALKSGIGMIAKVSATVMAAATGAVVGFGTKAVQVGSQFDTAMGGVAATMGKTMDEMEGQIGEVDTQFGHFSGTLREFAIYMGKNTAFSASEAAQALNYMALAGYNTQQSMEMLPTVLNMAAAGTMDLARASDMVTDISAALGLSVEENADRIALMADEFAKAASTGNTSVEQLGDAFLKIGGLASETNGGFITLSDGTLAAVDSIQEMEIALTAMANAGVKGNEAGTHMRNMLLKLSSPTDKGAAAMEALGVSVFDAEGNMRSLVDIFTDLKVGLDSVTQQEKLEAIGKIFNARDIASAEALLGAVEQDWNYIGESILQAQGAAGEMAGTKLDNLTGDMTLFRSALESAYITMNDQLSPTLREFVQFGTEGVQKLTDAFEEGGVTGAMGAFGEVLAEGLNQVIETLPKILEAAGTVLDAFVQGLVDNTDVILQAGADIIDLLFNSILEASNTNSNTVLDIITSMLNTFNENGGGWIDAGFQIVSNILNGITESIPDLIDATTQTLNLLVNKLTDPTNIGKIIGSGVKLFVSLGQGLIKAIPQIIAMIPVFLNNLLTALKENAPIVIDGIVQLVNMIVEYLPEIIQGIAEALPVIIQTLTDTLITLLPEILNGIVQLVQAIVENLPTILQALIDAIPTIIQAFLDAWMTALPAVIQAFIQYAAAIIPYIPQIIAQLIAAIPQIIAAIVEGFVPLIGEIVNLFASIGSAISQWWSQKKADIASGFNAFLTEAKAWFDKLPYNLGVALGDMIAKFGEFAANAGKWVATEVPKIINSIVNFFKELPGKIWEWLLGVIDKVGEWGSSMIDTITTEVPKIIDSIVKFFEELPGKALQWGKDMISNFIDGIGAMAEEAWNAVADFAKGIADRLGFSEPEIGPLSDFHTYAPDMMKLFAEGIENNADLVNDAIEKNFDFSDAIVSPDVDYQQVYQNNTESALNQMISLLQELVDGGMEVSLEGDAREIFRVVEKQNRRRTKATGYNSLGMAGTGG